MLHSCSPTRRAARPSAGRRLRAESVVALAVPQRQQLRPQHRLQVLGALLLLREALRHEVALHLQVQEALPSSCSFVSKRADMRLLIVVPLVGSTSSLPIDCPLERASRM